MIQILWQKMKAVLVFLLQVILSPAIRICLLVTKYNFQLLNVHHQQTLASPLHADQMLSAEKGMVQDPVPACLALKVIHMIREVVGVNVKSMQTVLKC
jgi:hypothetical protein